MSNRVERYFSLLSEEQLDKVTEIATDMISKGIPENGKYYIKFAGDISRNPEDVIDLISTTVAIESSFELSVFANCKSYLVLSKTTKPEMSAEEVEQKRKEIGRVGMAAARSMLSTSGNKQKLDVSKTLDKNLQEIKKRYA